MQRHLATQGFATQLIDIARAAVARALLETGCHPRRPQVPVAAENPSRADADRAWRQPLRKEPSSRSV